MANYLAELLVWKTDRAVVIGGTGVLGGQIATSLAKARDGRRRWAKRGARGKERCDFTIAKEGGIGIYLPVNVMSHDSIQQLHDKAEQQVGPIDILVNGTGVNSAQPYFEIDDATWQKIFTTNVVSLHWACQIFCKEHDLAAGEASSTSDQLHPTNPYHASSLIPPASRPSSITRRISLANWVRRESG